MKIKFLKNMGLFSRPRIQFNLPSFVVELTQLCTTNRLFSLVSVYTVRKNIIGEEMPHSLDRF